MKRKTFIVGIFLAFTLIFPLLVSANASEPPIIIIMIPEVGLDVEATLENDEVVWEGIVRERKIETYISFYSYDLDQENSLEDQATLVVKTNQGEVAVSMDLGDTSYNQLYTLDLEKQTLTEGKSLMRDLSLIGMRLSLTLIIEGFIFFVMGYRQFRTWVLFLIINLVTQGYLNYSITMHWTDNGYVLFGFVVLEVIILAIEWIAFLLSVKEGKKLKLWLTITLANVLSLFVGGYLIVNFPL